MNKKKVIEDYNSRNTNNDEDATPSELKRTSSLRFELPTNDSISIENMTNPESNLVVVTVDTGSTNSPIVEGVTHAQGSSGDNFSIAQKDNPGKGLRIITADDDVLSPISGPYSASNGSIQVGEELVPVGIIDYALVIGMSC